MLPLLRPNPMSDPSRSHAEFMRRAIALAAGRVGRTGANPAVGCVLVRDGVVVGEGATGEGGRPHAEQQALEQAGEKAAGARAYLTLEPCGERSVGGPSCAARLLQAGVTEVFVACHDGSPYASGRGTARLREQGVAVTCGLLEAEAAPLYAGYVHARRSGKA